MSNELVEVTGAEPATEVEQAEVEKTEPPKEEASGEAELAEGEGSKKPELSEADRVRKATQRRIDKLTRDRAEANAKAEYLEKLLTEREGKKQGTGFSREQFASDEDFIEAEVRRRLQETEAEKSRASEHEQLLTRESKREKLLMDAELAGDFDREKFAKTVRVTPAMAEAVLESDVGDKLILHMYANPAEAERIANLSPLRQAAEIGKLEVQLSGRKEASPSKAPPPPKSLSGSGKSVNDGYREGMSVAEYAKWRGRKT